MVIVISSDAIARGLNLRSGHTKAYEIGINMSSFVLLFQQESIQSGETKLSVLVWFKTK
jgi:hypothetical protein